MYVVLESKKMGRVLSINYLRVGVEVHQHVIKVVNEHLKLPLLYNIDTMILSVG